MNPEKRSILPGLAFKGFSSRYQRPALSEGFQDITEVAFKVSSLHGYMHDNFRSDKAHCSLMEVKRNVRFGVGTGLKTDIDFVHELPCAVHVFSPSQGASFFYSDGHYPTALHLPRNRFCTTTQWMATQHASKHALMRNFSRLHQEHFQLALLQRPLIGSIELCMNNALLSCYNVQQSAPDYWTCIAVTPRVLASTNCKRR